MLLNSVQLPMPDEPALAHSNKLLQLIKQEILQQNGVISFARYMELALYAPGLGYYSAGAQKIGALGDFITAPEVSPLFSRCIARQCQQVLTALNGGDILELGAGLGSMAAAILLELENVECLPQHYFILETSADLRQRQQQNLSTLIPHLYERIIWVTNLPAIQGIIVANEVIDALPVKRFIIENKIVNELGVGLVNEQLVWQKLFSTDSELEQAVATLQSEELIEINNYTSEVNLNLPAWLNSLNDSLRQGLILLIDYGFPRKEYYHPQRNSGTLMCHYRQHAHSDPFWLPGLQDITAHVDFTMLAQAANAAHLTVSGYATQAAFLLSCGLLDFAQKANNTDLRMQLSLSQQIQKLTAPHEMGELFKVIALTKQFKAELLGFTMQNKDIFLL